MLLLESVVAVGCSKILQNYDQAIQIIQTPHNHSNGISHLQGVGTEGLIIRQLLKRNIRKIGKDFLRSWADGEDSGRKRDFKKHKLNENLVLFEECNAKIKESYSFLHWLPGLLHQGYLLGS